MPREQTQSDDGSSRDLVGTNRAAGRLVGLRTEQEIATDRGAREEHAATGDEQPLRNAVALGLECHLSRLAVGDGELASSGLSARGAGEQDMRARRERAR